MFHYRKLESCTVYSVLRAPDQFAMYIRPFDAHNSSSRRCVHTQRVRRGAVAPREPVGCAEQVQYCRLRGTAKGGAAGFAHLTIVYPKRETRGSVMKGSRYLRRSRGSTGGEAHVVESHSARCFQRTRFGREHTGRHSIVQCTHSLLIGHFATPSSSQRSCELQITLPF